jgi:protein involved in polysaccharide export with SLBB domain
MRQAPIPYILLFLALFPVLYGQDQGNTPQPVFHYERWEDYRVGVGDTLEVQVVDVPQLNQTVEVSASGEIVLHPVGALHVLDLTAAELETAIADALKERNLLQEPQVLVFVREYRAKRIYVSGELAFPGEFVMSRNLTALDAILLAGGLTPFADRYGYVHRRTADGVPAGPPPTGLIESPDVPREGVEIVQIDLLPLAEGRAPVPDVMLRAGDFVIVPRRTLQFYFVLGEVNQPLNYVYPQNRALMASQAIAGAGGPTRTAKMSEGIVVRYDADGNRHEMKVDFKALLEDRQQDFEVKPNDVIFIPGSKIRTIGEGYVMAANAMIAGTAFRVGRHYQLPDRPNREEIQ